MEIEEKKIAYHTPTIEAYREVVQRLLDEGYRWIGDGIRQDIWDYNKEDTCVRTYSDMKRLGYQTKEYYLQDGCKVIDYATPAKPTRKQFKPGDRVWVEDEHSKGYAIYKHYRGDYIHPHEVILTEGHDRSNRYNPIFADSEIMHAHEHEERMTDRDMLGSYRIAMRPHYSPGQVLNWTPYYREDLQKEEQKPYKIFKKLINNTMSIVNSATQSKETKALLHFNIIDRTGELTETGRREMQDFIFENEVFDKKAFTKIFVDAYKEEVR